MDSPLTEPADDRFQRWPFAANIARTLIAGTTADPLVVGLYGPWGDGKTTVLNYIERAIQDEVGERQHIVVRFNPWRYTDEASLLAQFFERLAEEVGAELRTQGDRFATWMKDYGVAIASLPGRADAAVAVADAASRTSLDDLRARLEAALNAFDGTVTVLVDDIDRLRRSDIQLLFGLVALTANFTRTTYVLAFDPEVVADALSEAYGYRDPAAGLKFLEKIIHVPLPLPQVEQGELREMCTEGIELALHRSGIILLESERTVLARDLGSCVEPVLHTARTAKRLGRVLEFLLPLVRQEVNPSDFVLMEALHLLFPDAYQHIVENTGRFVPGWTFAISDPKDREKEGKEYFERLLEAYGDAERRTLSALLARLFPRAPGLTRQHWHSGDEDSWLREQRACSPDYFVRYVTYAVRPDDVADAAVGRFIQGVSSGEDSVNDLRNLLAAASPDRALTKLRSRADGLDPLVSRGLIETVAKGADALEVDWPLFALRLKPRSQAAILVLELLRNIPAHERKGVILSGLSESATSAFVHEVHYWLVSPEARVSRGLVDTGTQEDLARQLTERIVREAATHPYLPAEVPGGVRLLSFWAARDQAAAKSYVLKTLNGDEARIDHFLTQFMSKTTRTDSEELVLVDLTSEGFTGLTSILDPADLIPFLERRFGGELGHTTDRSVYDLEPAPRAARQFIEHVAKTGGAGLPAED